MNPNETTSLRKLPILRIHDTDFYVDLKMLEFRQVDNAQNAISFKNVQDNGDHTAIVYDPTTKNAFQGTWKEMNGRQDVKLIKLPAMINLDRPGLIDQLNQNAADAYKKSQFGKIKLNQSEGPARKRKRRRRI